MLLALRVLAEGSGWDETKVVARGICTMSEYSSRGPREYLNVTLNATLNAPMILTLVWSAHDGPSTASPTLTEPHSWQSHVSSGPRCPRQRGKHTTSIVCS